MNFISTHFTRIFSNNNTQSWEYKWALAIRTWPFDLDMESWPFHIWLEQKKDLSRINIHLLFRLHKYHHNYSHFWIDTNISFQRKKEKIEATIDNETRDPEFSTWFSCFIITHPNLYLVKPLWDSTTCITPKNLTSLDSLSQKQD